MSAGSWCAPQKEIVTIRSDDLPPNIPLVPSPVDPGEGRTELKTAATDALNALLLRTCIPGVQGADVSYVRRLVRAMQDVLDRLHVADGDALPATINIPASAPELKDADDSSTPRTNEIMRLVRQYRAVPLSDVPELRRDIRARVVTLEQEMRHG